MTLGFWGQDPKNPVSSTYGFQKLRTSLQFQCPGCFRAPQSRESGVTMTKLHAFSQSLGPMKHAGKPLHSQSFEHLKDNRLPGNSLRSAWVPRPSMWPEHTGAQCVPVGGLTSPAWSLLLSAHLQALTLRSAFCTETFFAFPKMSCQNAHGGSF